MGTTERKSRTAEWAIVGGGIHGVHLATRLVGEARVDPERIAIVDPGDCLLDRWKQMTATTGMTHLRSPSVHHLDPDPYSLLRYGRRRKKRNPGLFAPPYDRPSLELFNAHSQSVVKTFGLAHMHVCDRATTCSVDCDSAHLQLASGNEIDARNVILALGSSEQPVWPDWAPREDDRITHIFSPRSIRWPTDKERIAVVGGGISAGQVALRLIGEGQQVHLIARHTLRRHQFDSDPGWLGPKFLRRFQKEDSFKARRDLITAARHKGSVPPEVHLQLRRAIEQGKLQWFQGAVTDLDSQPGGLRLRLSGDSVVEVERVMLATGFSSQRPGGSLVDSLISSASLPCAECGYPIVDSALRWHPRVRVAGPLAELELGPASRNIAGARHAGERIATAACQSA